MVRAGAILTLGVIIASSATAQDCLNWMERTDGAPSRRSGTRCAYDSVRRMTILFGGGWVTGGFDSDETWGWNGREWTQLFPTEHPTARRDHAMVHDPTRNVIVLFGGGAVVHGDCNDETWEWSGINWTQRFPSASPSARTGHGMAYDAARNVIVMFGGGLGDTGGWELNDTWEWSGTAWSECFPSERPSPRQGLALAHDPIRCVTVLFGGGWGDRCSDETWEWDGATWVQRFPPERPSARRDHAMVWDSVREVVVLFGGGQVQLGDCTDETWEWNGETWTERTPLAAPSPRTGHGMTFDEARGVTVLYGGGQGDTGGWELSDTWELRVTGDVDGDADIDLSDLAVLLGNYGTGDGTPDDGDFTGDGDVGLEDLSILLSVYETTCE